MENTRYFVNEKLQPVQHKVDLVCNIANLIVNRALDNPYGVFLLTSMQSTVSAAHSWIDYYIPPVVPDSTQGLSLTGNSFLLILSF